MSYKELMFGLHLKADIAKETWPGGMIGLMMKSEVRQSLSCESVTMAQTHIKNCIDLKRKMASYSKLVHFTTEYVASTNSLYLSFSSRSAVTLLCVISAKQSL